MDREIKFRGKNTDGDWVFGYFVNSKRTTAIIDNDDVEYEVNPETVGQFTGFKDIDGKEIFEGDILKGADLIVKVVWENGHFLAYDLDEISDCLDFLLNTFRLKVIGNIHDNPELLEVGK